MYHKVQMQYVPDITSTSVPAAVPHGAATLRFFENVRMILSPPAYTKQWRVVRTLCKYLAGHQEPTVDGCLPFS